MKLVTISYTMLIINSRLIKGLICPSRTLLSLSVRGLRNRVTPGYRDEKVVANEDGSIIICWHPEPKFPYEYSRPLPVKTVETDSKLKVQAVEDMKELYHHKPDRLKTRDLMRLTWTTKHRWLPNTYWRRQRQDPKERPFL